MLFYGVLGVIIGGRLGYALFYKPAEYLANPLEILMVWKGGMSFHGGLLGVLVAMALFARGKGRPFWQVMDVVAPCVPTGLAAGAWATSSTANCGAARPTLAALGDGLSAERQRHGAAPPVADLPVPAGRPAAVRAAVVVRAARAAAHGPGGAAFVWAMACCASWPSTSASPTAFLGLLALGMSMGQWLCVPMIAWRCGLWWWAGAAARDNAAMRQVFLDTETTGLNAAQGDRIIEIGCIELVNRRPSGRHLHHYVNPQRSSHPDAVRVHGITDDFLADKPLFERIATRCWPSWKAPTW
jgi:phosphatidylglycerol:prolipoprotein diacylglycerol transferase